MGGPSFSGTVGIGASDVASICHLSPFKSDWQTWLEKSGRRERPPQTAAMQFGIAMEDRAMKSYYAAKRIDSMREQERHTHSKYDWLRAIADGWNGEWGVNVKVPSSNKIIEMADSGDIEEDWDADADIDYATIGRVPRHYIIQCAAEMACFGADKWDYSVYDAEGDISYIVPICWDDAWDMRRNGEIQTLRDFWNETAIPLMERFMEHLDSGLEWDQRPETPMPDVVEWQEASVNYVELGKTINELKEERNCAKAKLKTMMGSRSGLIVAGYKADDKSTPPSFGVKITVDSLEMVQSIQAKLEPLKTVQGVKDVKEANRKDSRRFTCKPVTAKQARG